MNNDWHTFWGSYRKVEARSEDDLFIQVGKTIDKKPIPKGMFDEMITSIRRRLALSTDDILLDLCCGNGLVTYELGPFVGSATAVDFSEHLISAARRHKSRVNITYRVADVSAPLDVLMDGATKPTKLLMNDSLAYFGPLDLTRILENVLDHVRSNDFIFLLTGIPNTALKWNFYDTPERRAHHAQNQLVLDNVNDGLGRWWRPDEIEAVCHAAGLSVSITDQPAQLSNYRMDALIRRP